MKTSNQIKCENIIKDCINKYNDFHGTDIPMIPVKWSNRMTSSAGKCTHRMDYTGKHSFCITLSKVIMELNIDDFIPSVPVHELSHYIAEYTNPSYHVQHGAKWAKIMRFFGQSPDRCHTMKTPKKNRVEAKCGCTTHLITKQRVAKIKIGYKYSCRNCMVHLTLV